MLPLNWQIGVPCPIDWLRFMLLSCFGHLRFDLRELKKERNNAELQNRAVVPHLSLDI